MPLGLDLTLGKFAALPPIEATCTLPIMGRRSGIRRRTALVPALAAWILTGYAALAARDPNESFLVVREDLSQ